jgi:uncharacterized protein (DUF302 family)
MAPDGLAIYPSSYGPKEAMDRLVAGVTDRDITVLARIDHAEAAAKVGMTLRPTEVVIFGNPRAGTPLMQARQTMGIDLPLRALVWQDDEGKTWLAYNEPRWLAVRHRAEEAADHVLGAMTETLAAIAKEATETRG